MMYFIMLMLSVGTAMTTTVVVYKKKKRRIIILNKKPLDNIRGLC